MLYLALPPTQPPIVSILTPPSATQNNGCTLQVKSQKSDLVNNLLDRILANSISTKPCTAENQKSELSQLNTRNKPAKAFATIPPVSTSVKQKSITESLRVNKQAAVESNRSPNPLEKAPLEKPSTDDQSGSQKSVEKNPIEKIIATVQQLINVSLYASINNSIGDTVEPQIQNSAETASKSNASNSAEPTDKQNLEGTSSNDTNQIAGNTTINTAKIIAVVQELIAASISASLNNTIKDSINSNIQKSGEIALSNPEKDKKANNIQILKPKQNIQATNNQNSNSLRNSLINKLRDNGSIKLAQIPGEPFLVGVVINGREVGTLDIIEENNTLLIPLETFGEISGFSVNKSSAGIEAKTPLGTIKFPSNILKQINGLTYVSKEILQEKLDIKLELNTADLTLLADLPWRGGSRKPLSSDQLKPEFFAPSTGLSRLRQELNIDSTSGNTSLQSYTLLDGRLAGGTWRVQMNNDFNNQPNLTEYFFYKRSGQFRYQLGRQRVGLHPLVNGIDLTGLQFGYSNLPADYFQSTYSANELLPRRSQSTQTFSGRVPPASVVQLRVSGVTLAQQQVGFNGIYEFVDVRLPSGQSSEIEVLVFDRNNLRAPIDIRTVRINASDLLLPAGGNVQLGGLGFSGNLVQDSLFSDFNSTDEGKLVGFYQLRQGLSKNLTLEGSLQAIPNSFQGQAGLIWRLANPVVLSASVGNSFDKVGYSADLDIDFDKLEINANSQSLPQNYRVGRTRQGRISSINGEQYNHSLEARYRFNNKLNIGFVARSRKDDSDSNDYILPTFYARPFSNLSLSGRPDIFGDYLFNAFFTPSRSTRLSFNSYGDAYISDLTYDLNRNYQLNFGSEFGRSAPARYSVGVGHNPNNLRDLSWNVGLAISDGEVGPIAGASMQVLPGLFARLNYEAIPSRGISFGGLNDGRFSLSLTSDMSFAGGKIAPARYSGISKERGAISGQLAVEGGRKGFDLSGSIVRIFDTRNQNVGSARTDSNGNFLVGNLPEGVYVVELEPEELPIELAISKTSLVAEVASSGVTRVDFPIRTEYGVAGKVTDASGQPLTEVRVELVTNAGKRVLSSTTDRFGLYRLDGVPVGKYILQVSPLDTLNSKNNLPKRQVEINNQFVYNQNLQLPVSAAAKKKQ
ncbi:carboxypeptidase-like regulatory domain-containing protein [Rivularia sp. UHCC 0363]|uniref:carboxypeptidase-like regulatory domain-containing protein n=1 Tax=Rivularia sp. UHCC 0363 TaxID=3110244 RepID=UPI002B21AB6D|nr:carboxypeptidase-like regulatory domain-containing protein [Rivularia sp. UHCC 0363]MEA5593959.1 carboxypeptidase-like regulatory domain-containing protein [Rivularia sp. UHCC 0363]